MRGRGGVLGMLAGATAALAVLAALAGNAATATERWPGVLDLLRTRPWESVGVLGATAVAVAVGVTWWQERAPAGEHDPPVPPAPALGDWIVPREEQTAAAVAAVCGGRRTVGVTTSLWGAGGFGKTTLAEAVCADPAVRKRFRERVHFVTIGRDVRGRAAIAAKVAAVTRYITGDTAEFGDDPGLAGAHLGRLLDQRPRTLLVLDDVWDGDQLAPFLHGGQNCVRLVTTRNPGLLPPDAERIRVDAMSVEQARTVLGRGLPPLPEPVIAGLVRATGRWALLLRLANGVLARQLATGAEPVAAAEALLRRLREAGPGAVDDVGAAWDLDDPRLRSRAVTASIKAATTLLPGEGAQRLAELCVFAEDEPVPIRLAVRFWSATGGLPEHRARALCAELAGLSLVGLDPADGGRITLHDVVRDYLRGELAEDGIRRTNAALVDAIAPEGDAEWWETDEPYIRAHLVAHLVDAGLTATAVALAGDVRWVEMRLLERGPTAPWSDLDRIGTEQAGALARTLARIAHALAPTDPPHSVVGILHRHLEADPHWRPQVLARRDDPATRPVLVNRLSHLSPPETALVRTLTGHTAAVRALAVAPDGSWLATGGGDRTIRIWDRASGVCTVKITGCTSAVEALAISPDGTWLATAENDSPVRIWDRATGALTAELTGTRPATCLAISPDGTWIATSGDDKRVRLWTPSTGECRTFADGHQGYISAMSVAPDGAWLITAGSEGTVRRWDPGTGNLLGILTDHRPTTGTLALAPDGSWLASGGRHGVRRIRLHRSGDGRTPDLATGPVTSMVVAPDGSWLVTTGGSREALLWDLRTGALIAELPPAFWPAKTAAIGPDGSWLATAGVDDAVRIWDRAAAVRRTLGRNTEGASWPLAAAFASDGSWFVTAGTHGAMARWDRRTGECLTRYPGLTGSVLDVAVAPDDSWIAVVDESLAVVLLHPLTGDTLARLEGHLHTTRAVAVAPDGSWLASGGDDRVVRLWDRATGTCTTRLAAPEGRVSALAVAPDGGWLAGSGTDAAIRVWDLSTGQCTMTLTGHEGAGSAVAVAADGTWLASGSLDRTVRIWDRATGTCTAVLRGHPGRVQSVAVSPDDRWIASTDDHGTVRIWDAQHHIVAAFDRIDEPCTNCAWGQDGDLVVTSRQNFYVFGLLV